ncbi:auxin-responsive protein SAUR64-like protein [Cinnamomum micranthum f. kanehirae]|uniref:Auxin-responsive protein SAUR64-like protein n=1 Tax=Cinnamomum micranthum f. kanehirae TaxID=337451 RepID=A0A3S3QUA8_9MAGN|nr:auxin-responsive protein SAUR64-like protein [Cinnamomum micranthum f. kanehirae]
MINSQRLLKMARKWQKFAVNARRRISAPISGRSVEAESCIKSVADRGHFVVYTIDGKRFMVPLDHLNSPIFVELLRLSEEQFGLPCDGPITIPCEAFFMEYVISFLQRRLSKEVGTSLLTSMAAVNHDQLPQSFEDGKEVAEARCHRKEKNHHIKNRSIESETCAKSVAEKGHFFVYTIDGSRFMVS